MTKPMADLERGFQRAVIEYAHLMNWLVHHTRPARTANGWRTPLQGDPGFPDLVLAKPGRLIIRELKREGVRPTPEQRLWLEALEDIGSIDTGIWRPSDWPKIERILKE